MSTLPRGSTAGSPTVTASARGGAVLRILLVDDDAARSALLVEALRDSGYDVTAAASAEEALTAFARAPVPLVVLDTDLPGIGGIEVCRRIRSLDAARTSFVVVYSRRDSLEA